MAEKVVSELIKSSSNFDVLLENIQVLEGNRTIGEIDFIIEELSRKQIIHMELAYKFYLLDPSISSVPINNWIGPNRNDSLKEKLEKLKIKQFPLLYHDCARSKFEHLELDEVSQSLCLLASLFIPYQYKENLDPNYEKAIQGYYLNLETFISLDHSGKKYCMPPKKEWGMDPAVNESWMDFNGLEESIGASMKEKQSPLCWQKYKDAYSSFFIVWW